MEDLEIMKLLLSYKGGGKPMSFLVKEEVFERFIIILKNRFKRNPSNFQFIAESKDNELFMYLDDYLRSGEIQFAKKGIGIYSQDELPVRIITDDEETRLSSGIYFIYPETDKEIIIYYYELASETHSTWKVIIGYKKSDVFDNFLSNLKEFYVVKNRSNNRIIIFRGEDIERPNLSWDEIILPATLKEDIKQNIEDFINRKEHYRKLNIPYKRGFLFTGPPGNGKTMLLKVIASDYKSLKFIYFKFDQHSDNDDINNVFQKAKELAPSILCFEDIDSLFKSNITLSHFLNKLDGFEERDGTLILATTNHPEEIDPAITSRPSRFDRVWMINNPEWQCRKIFLQRHFNGLFSDSLVESITAKTEGFSMAYLKELFISASMLAINKGLNFPEEDEIIEFLRILTSQVKNAKRKFEFERDTLGFVKEITI
jgi:AAA+ superfamily predicted ATPase